MVISNTWIQVDIGYKNRVNREFRSLSSLFYPSIHISPYIIDTITDMSDISIATLQTRAGKGSGLIAEIKRLFSSNPRWYFGRLKLRSSARGRDWFDIVDFYWKPANKKK